MADQRREPNQRPSPDALLAKASKEESRERLLAGTVTVRQIAPEARFQEFADALRRSWVAAAVS